MANCGIGPGVSGWLRLAAGVCLAATTIVAASGPAQARHSRHFHRHYSHHYAAVRTQGYARTQAVPSSPAFSAIVVDANTGRELYGANENALRHPASITKVMTLYLLFEQLDKGAMTLATRIPISEHAAAQEPSKLGIAAGETISVEDAIKAVVTRSANDVAVAIAEAIGHDEDAFAQMMTRKAHSLGMSRTIYRNASGLPNDEQITTARDLTVLARATEERFPKYFKYYSTHEFEYAGEVIGNHNHLLGRIDGVDGIKTGYTRASGFNLLTSVHRDGRSIVAVVLGGRTSGARDRVMENLISDHLAEASNQGHSASMIAENDGSDADATPSRPVQLALAKTPVPPARPTVDPQGEGDNTVEDDAEAPPRPVLAVAKAPAQPPLTLAALAPPAPAPAEFVPPARVEKSDAPTPRELGWVKGAEAARNAKSEAPLPAPRPRALAQKDEVAKTETRVARADDGAQGGWVIQIGASEDADKANDLLIRARAQNRATLASAKAFTEKVKKGEGTFYRARFAGLDSNSAEQACRALKRNGFSCFTAHD